MFLVDPGIYKEGEVVFLNAGHHKDWGRSFKDMKHCCNHSDFFSTSEIICLMNESDHITAIRRLMKPSTIGIISWIRFTCHQYPI